LAREISVLKFWNQFFKLKYTRLTVVPASCLEKSFFARRQCSVMPAPECQANQVTKYRNVINMATLFFFTKWQAHVVSFSYWLTVLHRVFLRSVLVLLMICKAAYLRSVYMNLLPNITYHAVLLYTGYKCWLGGVWEKSSSDHLQGQLLLSVAGVSGRIFETDAI
jgi:hypothetical protein